MKEAQIGSFHSCCNPPVDASGFWGLLASVHPALLHLGAPGMWLKHPRSPRCSCGCWGHRQRLGVHGVPLHGSPSPTQHPAPTRWAFLPLACFFPPPPPVIYFISPHPAALPWERGGSPGWMRLSRHCTPGPRCRQPAPWAGYGPGPGSTPACGVTPCTHPQHPWDTPAPELCTPDLSSWLHPALGVPLLCKGGWGMQPRGAERQ